MGEAINKLNLKKALEGVKTYVDSHSGGGANYYIWDVDNPVSYNEIKAIVEAGERPVIIKRNGHYYYPFQYGVNEYPGEPELPCEFNAYFTSGTNYRYILNYQCDSDKTDQPMTAVVDRSEEVAAKLSGSVYSNIDSASSYVRFMNNELKVATGINNSTKERLEFTFKSSSDQLVKKVPLFPEYEVGGKPQLIGSIKEGNTTYNLYQFYFTAYNLPNNASGVYNLSVILADYTVTRFTEVSGMQHNSVQIGSPVFYVSSTDPNNKTITIKTTTNMGIAGALLKITFMGSKN